MITSAENRDWASDVAIGDHAAVDRPAPSVVRTAKIAVIDARDAERLGVLPRGDRVEVAGRLRQFPHVALIGD